MYQLIFFLARKLAAPFLIFKKPFVFPNKAVITYLQLVKKKEFLYYTGGSLCTGKNLYPGISFLGAFCY
jgi:hypothetical protein